MLRKSYQTVLRFFEKYYWICFAAACLVLAFYCFRCLGVQYVDSWDEARHGVNAYEMIQNGDYIQHTYNYEVDDWNLKPSISYWGILLGFKIFGYNAFGLRFVSALAYLVTGIGCGLFAKRYSKEASILVMGFFCANTLPLSAHLARSGDADSLYLLFFTFAMLAMFRIRENKKNLYFCGLMFALAFLTKSWHAGMIAAIGGLYLLVSRELFRLKGKEWLGFAASALVPILLWFGWRFTKDGFWFLQKMIEVDLLARTGSANFEGHSYPFRFYYDVVFANESFIYRWLIWICVLGAVAGLLWLWKKKAWTRTGIEDAVGYLLWFFVPFLGFSLIETKLIWYCYPCIVPLFLVAAIFLGKLLRSDLRFGLTWLVAAGSIFLVAFFMKNTYFEVIRDAHGDGFQLFMQESVERDSDYAGRRAYVEVPTEDPEEIGTWDQNMLFVAEISGNFRCMDGGWKGFLEEKKPAVLYLTKGQYKEFLEADARAEEQDTDIEQRDVKVLYENEGYVLLGKDGLPDK